MKYKEVYKINGKKTIHNLAHRQEKLSQIGFWLRAEQNKLNAENEKYLKEYTKATGATCPDSKYS
tara:strand:- start:640 stop:834 length:195 start_codon:yes stop_codon:yes gene_type:complete